MTRQSGLPISTPVSLSRLRTGYFYRNPYAAAVQTAIANAPGGGIWYPLRDSGAIAYNRAYIGGTGPELITGGDFDPYSAAQWTVVNVNGTTRIIQADANGALFSDTDASGISPQLRQAVITPGDSYEFNIDLHSLTSGQMYAGDNSGQAQTVISAAGLNTFRHVAYTNTFVLSTWATTADHVGVVRSASLRKIGELDSRIIGSPSQTPDGKGLVLNANGKYLVAPNGNRLDTLGNAAALTILVRANFYTSGAANRFILSFNSAANLPLFYVTTIDQLVFQVGDASARSNDAVPEGTPIWLAGVFNAPDKEDGIHLYMGESMLSELTLAADTTLTARGTVSTELMYAGNRSANDRYMNADLDEWILIGDALSLDELNSIIAAAPT